MLQKSLVSLLTQGSNTIRQITVRHASGQPLKTCLYDFHVASGGKMVDFAGYSMPVQYSNMGAMASHHHTRTNCSLFDVSHMLQTKVWGKDRVAFMESLTVADVENMKVNSGSLTVFTNSDGGIIDDLIVSNAGDHLYVVSNAGCRHKDIPLMSAKEKEMKAAGKDVTLEFIDDRGLVALQGPSMMTCLQPLIDTDLTQLTFMKSIVTSVAGVGECRVTRCGYTGEDGVEISVPQEKAQHLVETILGSSGQPALAGLGARDSLRLEAGLCLYGNDIDEDTTPVEAALAWLIPKTRRARGGYPGEQVIAKQLKEGVTKKRVGFVSKQGPAARSNTEILDNEGNKVGKVTSGCPSPTIGGGTNVGMGYVSTNVTKLGSQLILNVRNKKYEAVITRMPFVPSNYYQAKNK